MSEQQELIIQPKGGNWNEVSESMPPVPPGVYLATISKFEVAENAKKTGTNLRFQYKITDEGPAKGRVLFGYIQFQPELDERGLRELMNRAGLKLADGQALRPADLIGSTVKLIVETEMYTDPTTKLQSERNKLPRLARE